MCSSSERIRVAAILLAFAVPLFADEARIPVAGPMVIGESGHYVVTRDFTAPAGASAIRITADRVTLDLNGHHVQLAGTTWSGVEVLATDVTVRNGRLSGGNHGVWHGTTPTRIRLFVEEVEITDTASGGIHSGSTAYAEISNCRIVGATATHGIQILGDSAAFGGRFLENTVIGPGGGAIVLQGLRGGEVVDNVIADTATVVPTAAITLTSVTGWNAGGNLVSGNTVRGGAVQGILVTGLVPGNAIRDNVATGNDSGLWVDSDGNVVTGNVLSANTGNGAYIGGSRNRVRNNASVGNGFDGLQIAGQFNLLEANLVEGNGTVGLNFLGSNHVYRGNILRGNAVFPVGGAANATDAGGNIQ